MEAYLLIDLFILCGFLTELLNPKNFSNCWTWSTTVTRPRYQGLLFKILAEPSSNSSKDCSTLALSPTYRPIYILSKPIKSCVLWLKFSKNLGPEWCSSIESLNLYLSPDSYRVLFCIILYLLHIKSEILKNSDLKYASANSECDLHTNLTFCWKLLNVAHRIQSFDSLISSKILSSSQNTTFFPKPNSISLI